jgi:hypothetical protein
MRGAPLAGTPELAGWLEESVRGILREAALGEIPTDVASAADESLIATGLEGGDAEISVSASSPRAPVWETPAAPRAPAWEAPAAPGREAEEAADYSTPPEADADRTLTPSAEAEGPANDLGNPEEEHMHHHQDTRIMEPIPAEDEIRITATDWLDEVEVESEAHTLEWTSARRDEGREPIDTPTVRHLFPVPEDADWQVRELEYDHYDRRRAG